MGKTKSARRREALNATPQRQQQQQQPPQWVELEQQLCGLLSLQIDGPFIDHEHLCPERAWLVLHLDLVRPTAYVRSTVPLVEHALQALATLCVQSELLRSTAGTYDAFWRRVLTSDVVKETLSPHHAAITRFTCFSRCKGVQVLLSWQGKRFPSAVCPLLRTFLAASVSKYEATAQAGDATDSPRVSPLSRPLAIGVCFSDCGLTVSDLRTLSELLHMDSDRQRERRLLFESHRLATLDLSGNAMGVAELRRLGELLGRQSRRVDELRLEKTFPLNAAEATNGEYCSAFKRVLELALTANVNDADCGVSISLAHNTMYDGVHFHALHDALVTASRPLRALSLADTWQERSAWSRPSVEEARRKWFAWICLTSPATAFANDCALDLSRAGPDVVPHDMDAFHEHQTDAVVANVSMIQKALANGENVRCRVRSATLELVTTEDTSYPHRITQIRSDGWFVVESNGSSSTDWLPPSSLSALCTANADILRLRFRSLLCDADVQCVGPHTPLPRQPWVETLVSVGPEIRRLAFRRWFYLAPFLAETLPLCPNLVELYAVRCKIAHPRLPTLFRIPQARSLRVVNLSGSDIDRDFLKRLAEVAGVVELRYLSILDVQVDLNMMIYLREALEQNDSLECVELDAFPKAPRGDLVAEERFQTASSITRNHDRKRLRLMPLSAGHTRAISQVVAGRLGNSNADLVHRVVSRCLELANAEATRSIVWCSPLPAPRWRHPRR